MKYIYHIPVAENIVGWRNGLAWVTPVGNVFIPGPIPYNCINAFPIFSWLLPSSLEFSWPEELFLSSLFSLYEIVADVEVVGVDEGSSLVPTLLVEFKFGAEPSSVMFEVVRG